MKKIVYALTAFMALALSACLNTTTESTIRADGSGTVLSVIDMSGIFDLMEQMGKGPGDDEKLKTPVDSTMNLKDMIAQAEKKKGRALTADEKELYENSTLHMKMNMDEKVMRFTINTKFSKLSQLALIKALQDEAMDQSPMGNSGEDQPQEGPDEIVNKTNEAMRFNSRDGLIEYAFDSTKYQLSEEEQQMMAGIDQLAAVMGESTIKMVYNLPRPAKNVTAGGKYEMSGDKKKITISYNFLDVFKDPAVQAYRIEY